MVSWGKRQECLHRDQSKTHAKFVQFKPILAWTLLVFCIKRSVFLSSIMIIY